jgi:hypothetical protein
VSKLRSTLVTVATLSVLAACGGDDDPLGVNSGDPLTAAEIQAVFLAISESFNEMNSGASAAGPARAPVAFSQSLSGSATCPEGGSMAGNGSASGTVDDETFVIDLTYQLRLSPAACAVPTETAIITLDAAPYVQLDMDFLLTETLIDISGTQSGGIAFTSSDGRSGSCAFDIAFSVDADLEGGSGTSSVSGTVCGVSAEGLQVWDFEQEV